MQRDSSGLLNPNEALDELHRVARRLAKYTPAPDSWNDLIDGLWKVARNKFTQDYSVAPPAHRNFL